MANSTLRLVALGIISLASIFIGFIWLSPREAEDVFRAVGYWNIVALLVAFISYTWKDLVGFVRASYQNKGLIAVTLICLALTSYLYTREGGGFKIVFDEQNLTNVSLSLHKYNDPIIRESTLMDEAYYQSIDKRPLLFPVLLSLVHDVFGYYPKNPFYLNFCFTFAFLFLLSLLVRRIHSNTAGFYVLVLAASFPLIEQNSSGGGFELLNLSAILLCTIFSMKFWKNPDDASLSKLILCVGLASHVRYESSIIILPVAALYLAACIRARRLWLPLPVILIPLAYITLPLQYFAIRDQATYWQSGGLSGSGTFSMDYLAPNLRHAWNFLFSPNPGFAGSPIIAVIGLLGLMTIGAFSITRAKRFYRGHSDRVVAVAFAGCMLVHTFIILVFYFGQLDNSLVSRLGFPLFLLLIVCASLLLGHLHRFNKAGRYAALGLVLASGIYANNIYSKTYYTDKNGIHAQIDRALDFAKTLPKDGRYLFITPHTQIFELEGFNNLSTKRVNVQANLDRIESLQTHFELMTYDAIYVFEFGRLRIMEDGSIEKKIFSGTSPSPAVKTEQVWEGTTALHNFTRISKVVSIDSTKHRQLGMDEIDPNEFKSFHMPQNDEYMRWKRSLP